MEHDMELKEIAEVLAVPLPLLTGAKPKPALKLIQGGKVDKPERKG